jgi:hypothetical protein
MLDHCAVRVECESANEATAITDGVTSDYKTTVNSVNAALLDPRAQRGASLTKGICFYRSTKAK